MGVSEVELRLEGRRTGFVEVVDMRLRTQAQTDLEPGAILHVPCDGEVGVVNLGFRLKGAGVAYEIDQDGQRGRPYFAANKVTLAKDEALPLSAGVDAGDALAGIPVSDLFVWSLDISVGEDGEQSVVSLEETFVTASDVEFALNQWTLLALDGPLRWWT